VKGTDDDSEEFMMRFLLPWSEGCCWRRRKPIDMAKLKKETVGEVGRFGSFIKVLETETSPVPHAAACRRLLAQIPTQPKKS
jgi:hypothetical protein